MTNIKQFLITVLLFAVINAQPFASDFKSGISSRTTPPTCRQALSQCLKRLDRRESCQILPVPQRSRLPLVPQGQFRLVPLRRSTWLYTDGNYNSIIMVTPKRLALIDFAETFTSNSTNGTGILLADAVERVIGDVVPKRIDMIYSHAHYDHIGSATRFYTYITKRFPNAKIVIWGTKETRDLIKASDTKRAVPPNVIITKRGRTLRLDESLQISMSMLGGHTQQDLMIFIPRFRRQPSILFAVDVVFPKWVMPFNLAITQNVRALINANKAILEKDFDLLVAGHLQVGNKNDVRINLEYLQDLLRISREAPTAVSRLTLFQAGVTNVGNRMQREFGNLWWVIRLFRETEIDICYRRMIEKWGCRLAAVDVHLRGHCLVGSMFESTDA